jgi:hypothetical protein
MRKAKSRASSYYYLSAASRDPAKLPTQQNNGEFEKEYNPMLENSQ